MRPAHRIITIKQAINIAKKFGVNLMERSFDNIPHGGVVFQKKNEKTGQVTIYRLKRYFMQRFNLNYSCHADIKKGKELIISNVPLPNINKFFKKYD